MTWVTMRLAPRPKHKSVRQLRRLSHKILAERCWAADINDEYSTYSASEAWARVAELVDMLEGRRAVDQDLLVALHEHREHVAACRTGSCEHEYAALVRADAIPTPLVSDRLYDGSPA